MPTFDQTDPEAARSAAVLSYGLWQEDFGGDDGAIGRTITLDLTGQRVAFTVADILPRDFHFASQDASRDPPADIWLSAARPFGPGWEGRRWLETNGRVRIEPAR